MPVTPVEPAVTIVPAAPLPSSLPAEVPRPKLTPLAPERFALQVTIDQETYDRLRYAQALLSHRIPSQDLALVLARLVQLGVAQVEKGRFAATDKPRENDEVSSTGGRYVPARVKRAVWERDGGQCAFVSPTGQRCPATTFLEFDHVDPVALGGKATVDRMATRCRPHNLLEAERVFGKDFMKRKQDEARDRLAARARAAARTPAIRSEPSDWDGLIVGTD